MSNPSATSDCVLLPALSGSAISSAHTHIARLLDLLALERKADQEYYREKVTFRSLHQRVKEGTTWYPVRLLRNYTGTGERNIVELERSNNLDKAHSFQNGKTVNIFSNSTGKPERDHLTGVVNFVRDNVIAITVNTEDLPDWIDGSLLGIDVMFDEMTYREMEYALRQLAKAEDNRLEILREILVGDSNLNTAGTKSRPEQDWLRSESEPTSATERTGTPLNESQQAAIATIHRAEAVALIHGPPGTGKTTTLVEAICQTLRRERQVLVCAPSNAAIDLLVEKLDARGARVIRIGHPARVTEGSLSLTLDARLANHPQYTELRRMRKRMEELRTQAYKYKRHFGFSEREERRMLIQESKSLKADAELLEFYMINDLLQQSEVICCTLTGASHHLLKGKRFRTVFIDEAGQALEPACWIPMLKADRLIMAGDHCQLPPTVKSREAALQGLSKTLFESVANRYPQQATMLRVQYRMHTDIMAFPSSWFYEGNLEADASVAYSLLRPNIPPVTFLDTAGSGYEEAQDPETRSRYNEQEAELVLRMTEQLVEEIGLDHWLEEDLTLGIITPYQAQVERLRKLAEASPVLEPLHKLVSIHTVDAMQGQERDIIIISLVRSNPKGEVGFLSDIRRTNVAMTRARRRLIMIGDSATLAGHPFYEKLINHFQDHEAYRSIFELE